MRPATDEPPGTPAFDAPTLARLRELAALGQLDGVSIHHLRFARWLYERGRLTDWEGQHQRGRKERPE